MYSQNDEEKYILEHVAKKFGPGYKGTVLDIGAYDGLKFSNTAKLIEMGWSGVLVEASPANCANLLRRYRDRPDITIVNAALAIKREIVRFMDADGDGIATTEQANYERWKKQGRFRQMFLQTLDIMDFFKMFSEKHDVVSIDTEGTSVDLFSYVYWMSPSVIIVEHDGRQEEAVKHGQQCGYRVVAQNPENIIFVR